uniref:Uncharacterized protein n=1 Tax=Plectus sambesii TaxID=2011161 RepID=A0A914V1N9_9BILA
MRLDWPQPSLGVCLLLLLRYVKASLPTAPPAAVASTSVYPDHETMVARMTKINEILDEARFGKSRPGRRYDTETMLMRPEEEGTGDGLLQGDYSSHHPWGVDDEDLMDGSGSGAASDHTDVAEYADIGTPVWPEEPVQSKPPAKEKPLWTASETHPEDQSPAAKTASQRQWWSALAFALFVFAFVRW